MSETLDPPSHPAHEASPKRQAIVSAAAKLFMANGYGSVSMDAIARAAGVSKATLYAHFASKDALFATIIGGKCAAIALEGDTFLTDGEDIGVALNKIGRHLMHFLVAPETQAMLRVVISESGRFPEHGAAFLRAGPEKFLARLREWFAAQHEAGRLVVPDAQIAADQFSALMRPLMFLRAMVAVPPSPTEAEIATTVDAAVTTFLRAFKPNS